MLVLSKYFIKINCQLYSKSVKKNEISINFFNHTAAAYPGSFERKRTLDKIGQ